MSDENDRNLGGRSLENDEGDEKQLVYEEMSTWSLCSVFCANTSAHGLGKISGTNSRILRVVWSFIFLASFAIFCYQTYMLVVDYLTWPVTMSMSVVNQPNSEFPAITICNQNKIKRSALNGTRFEPLVDIDDRIAADNLAANQALLGQRRRRALELAPHSNHSAFDFTTFVGDQNDLDWKRIMDEIDASQLIHLGDQLTATRDEIHQMGHSLHELIVDCEFDQAPCSANLTQFETFAHDRYGLCHTFNHGLDGFIQKTSNVGAEYGLKLALFVDQDEYLGMATSAAGVRVAIHEPGTTIFPEEQGFDAAVGTQTAFGMRANELRRTAMPYNNEDCRETDKYNKSLYRGKYTWRTCSKGCLQMSLLNSCGCVSDLNLKFDNVPLCEFTNKTQSMCKSELIGQFHRGQIACDCAQRCDEIYYSVQYSTTQWPSRKHEAFVLTSINGTLAFDKLLSKSHDFIAQKKVAQFKDEIKRNLLQISLTFEELNKQLIVESPKYDIWGLLSNIGGTLGLYVGISVITLFEIIEVITDIFLFCCCFKLQKPNYN